MTDRRDAGPRPKYALHDGEPKLDAKGQPIVESWWFVVDIGASPDGKRRQAKRRGFPTKKAALAAIAQLRVDVDKATYVAPTRQTFAEFVRADWLPTVRMSRQESTAESYERNLELHVLPRIGSLQLQAIDPPRLNRLYAELLADGRRDTKKGGLSARTVRYIHTIISAALEAAVKWDRLVRNPAHRADPPSIDDARPPEMRTWSAAELRRFFDLAADDRYFPAWYATSMLGARRGEVLGLRWRDVDLDGGVASILWTVTAVKHQIRIKPRTKTGRGRVVELDAGTVAVLRSWRARRGEERLLLGQGRIPDDELVFCHPDGRPIHPERFSREFDRRIARWGLQRIRLHDLRHTWATLALEAGINMKVVSDRLGHATTGITSDIYSHVKPAVRQDAADRVAGLVFGAS